MGDHLCPHATQALIADRYEEIIIDMGATTGGCERLLSTVRGTLCSSVCVVMSSVQDATAQHPWLTINRRSLVPQPMPVSYTRFTGRSLMLWLMSMPLALWPQLGAASPARHATPHSLVAHSRLAPRTQHTTPQSTFPLLPHRFLAGWTVVPAMFIISYVVIGIDEIGVEIEEPFCILPLLDLCNALKRDCKIAMDNADLFKSQFAEAAAAGAAGAAGAGAAAGAAPGGGVEAKLA